MLTGLAIILALILIVGVTVYNEKHARKYNKLMSHLEEHHPDIYEQTRIKPVFGPFYAKGAYKKSIDYAKNHELLEDPNAENLLEDYAEFSDKIFWLLGAFVLIAVTALIGWMLFTVIA